MEENLTNKSEVKEKEENIPEKEEAGLKKEENIPEKEEARLKKEEARLKKEKTRLKKEEIRPKKSLAERGLPGFFLNSRSVAALIGKIVLLLLIPYAWIFLCGLVFDQWLKLYSMTGFIFWSMIVLLVLAVVISVISVIRFVKKKKKK